MTPKERLERHELNAKAAKFVPVKEKVRGIQDSMKKMQTKLQSTNKAITKLNGSKSMNPKLKALRINKLRALQKYVVASIMLSKARIKNLQSPA